MISGRNFIIVSAITWDFLWQGSQELAVRLTSAGNRVLYVENMGVRSPSLREWRRVVSYLRKLLRRSGPRQQRGVVPGLHIHTPLVLPPFGPWYRRLLNRYVFLPRVARHARKLGFTDPIVITYLTTDSAKALVDMVRSDRSVVAVYYATDLKQFATDKARLQKVETPFLAAADVVFAQESLLAEHCRRFNANVRVAPHGTNVELFSRAAEGGAPPELASIGGPIIGYIGGLHPAVDYTMLAGAIAMRPEWTWLFIGSLQVPRATLPHAPNVHYLGARAHGELPPFVERFDVGIVPYLQGPSTDVVVPTKVGEYLAAGKPVVCTRLPTVVEFERAHRVLELSGPTAESFVQAIEAALTTTHDESAIRHRRAVARINDWSVRMEDLSRSIEEVTALRDAAASARRP
jgi:glycosyltransferase involved in cell wall biosynthesis